MVVSADVDAWVRIGRRKGTPYLETILDNLAEEIANGVTVTAVAVEGSSHSGVANRRPQDLFGTIQRALEILAGTAPGESGAMRACLRRVEV